MDETLPSEPALRIEPPSSDDPPTDLAATVAELRHKVEQASLIADLGRRLAEANADLSAVLQAVVERCAALIGDACLVRLLSADREWLDDLAFHHIDPAARDAMNAVLRSMRARAGDGVTGAVVQSGQPRLIAVVDPEEMIARSPPEYHAYLRRFGVRSLLAVPLRAAGEALGVVVMTRNTPGRPYGAEDQALLSELADRAALAIANARLFDALRRTHDEMERHVIARTAELAAVNNALQAEVVERERAERVARSHEHFLESIVENVPAMIFVKDAHDLRFVRFNRAGEELLGYPRSALLGKNDHDFFPAVEADFFTEKDREVLRGGQLVDIPSEPIHTSHRGTRLLHTKKIPLVDDAGEPRYLLGISEDITERTQAETALAEKAEELARSNAELEQFAYVASHDLQEPLRKIQAFADILAQTAGPALDAEARDCLDRMQSAAVRMRALINDLLTFSRVTRNALPLGAVDLGTIVREVLADLELRIVETGARVELGVLPEVYGDPLQLRQLLQNLVGNALKFRREGEPPVVRVFGRPVPGACEIVVEDDGIGFDQKYTDRIFRAFQRLHGRRQYEGTGIGLAICKKIAEYHRGTIRAESSPGHGATFIVTLPDAPAQETKSP